MDVTELAVVVVLPVLPEDRTKSSVSTPVTFSLKVTLYTSVWLSVFSAAGLYLSIDASVGAVTVCRYGADCVCVISSVRWG